MPDKPTPEQIAHVNESLKEPFPEEFDEWTLDDFGRFDEVIEGAMEVALAKLLKEMRSS